MEEKIIWKRMIYQGRDLGDFYLVSNTGEIKGIKTGKIRRKNINQNGYYFVGISLGSRENKLLVKIHKAVAETFINNPNKHPVVNHKDGNKLNNKVDNLEWCTYAENSHHAINHGLIPPQKGRQVICLNNKRVFDKEVEACKWCGLKGTSSIRDAITGRKNVKTAGKHPETGEPLQWMYYEDYIKEQGNICDE